MTPSLTWGGKSMDDAKDGALYLRSRNNRYFKELRFRSMNGMRASGVRCRRRSAGGSAGAEESALVRTHNAELFHLRLQGCSFHAEPGGGAFGTTQYPVSFAQGSQNVLALGLGQRDVAIPVAV